jgi:hypothetical protein
MQIEIYIGAGVLAIVAYLFRPILNEWISRNSKLFIDRKNRRREAIDKFRNVFIEEREKIKTFNIQNYFIQERAIFEVSRYLFFWQIRCLKRMWEDYQETENKYRQVLHTQDIPPNHLIHYGDHKGEVLSKIDKIINYL